MKRCMACGVVWWLMAVMSWGQGIDDQFIRIYRTIQEADRQAQAGQSAQALERYRAAQAALQRFQQANPQWNEKIINYRLGYVSEQIAALKDKVPIEASAAAAAAPRAPGTGAAAPASGGTNVVRDLAMPAAPSIPAVPAAPPDWEDQLKALRGQIEALDADRRQLQARLKEALSAQPAPVDAGEMARAEARILALEKEKELLRIALRQSEIRQRNEGDAALLKETQQALDEANKKLAAQEKLVADLRKAPKPTRSREAVQKESEALGRLRVENELLAARVKELEGRLDSPIELEALRKELTEAKAALDEQKKRNLELVEDQKRLNRELAALQKTARDREQAQRRAEEDLKEVESKLAERTKSGRTLTAADDARVKKLEEERTRAQQELARATAERRAAETALAQAERDKDSLEARLKEALDAQPARRAEAERIRQLEKERAQLQRQLADARREVEKRDRSNRAQSAMRRELAALKAKLDTYEAQKVPFTPEELAMFSAPGPLLASASGGAVAASDAASGSAPTARPVLSSQADRLVAEAERAFAARRFDEASQKFAEVLREDEQNLKLLGNLAASQLEQRQYEAAEATLRKALELAPNDARCLTLQGYLHFRQKRFDDAVVFLSRSVQQDPKNPEAQNYLGVALSEQGHRGPAETALRRAVQLSPDYGSAHHNLAVVYATQKPPFYELARWHYQKALNLGHGRNADLEQMLNRPTSPAP